MLNPPLAPPGSLSPSSAPLRDVLFAPVSVYRSPPLHLPPPPFASHHFSLVPLPSPRNPTCQLRKPVQLGARRLLLHLRSPGSSGPGPSALSLLVKRSQRRHHPLAGGPPPGRTIGHHFRPSGCAEPALLQVPAFERGGESRLEE